MGMTQNHARYSPLAKLPYDGARLYAPIIDIAVRAGADVVDLLSDFRGTYEGYHNPTSAEAALVEVFDNVFGPEFGEWEIDQVINDFVSARKEIE